MTDKRYFRSSVSESLITNDDDQGFPLIGELFSSKLMDNRDYFNRCLAEFQAGKNDLQSKLADARKVFFNKEDLHNWLYKIRKDAEHEIDRIFCEARANIQDDEEINFERIGHVAGLYKEAGRYLNIMIAIEPIDTDKPHFSIIDRLEEIDKEIVERELIPGYYRVQVDERIKKHKFELRTLAGDWEQYLELRNKGEVFEGFGDPAYLLNNYHTEFVWSMAKLKPLRKINDFLDYHLIKFTAGEEQDFLNHIQYRVVPRLDGFSVSDYPIYRQIILEWLNKKMYGLNTEQEQFLIDSVAVSLETFLDDILENRKRNDENKFNTVIKNYLSHRLISRHWHVADQSTGGLTDSVSIKSKAGVAFRDLVITDNKGKRLSAVECFRLKNNPTLHNLDHPIATHLRKIFRNEPIGVSPLIIIVYCETKDFAGSWTKYISYIGQLDFVNYQLINVEPDLEAYSKTANLKAARVLHSRELNTISIYHFMVNLYP